MIRRPVTWFVAFAMSVVAVPALAATSAMVQFGAFETRAEAETRLAEVKQKHAGLISGFATSVREVPLGSEGLTTYRTQAGPVSSKVAAQAICAQMASNGDECYVVETAMSVPAPAKATAPAAPATVYGGPERAIGAAPNASAVNDAAVLPTMKLPAYPSAATETPVAPIPLPNNVPPMPLRDPSSMAALANVNEAAAGASLAAPAAGAAAPSPSMQAAMDKAIADEAAVGASVAVKPAPQKSLMERMNPFASDEKPVAPAAPALPKPAFAAASTNVEPVQAAAMSAPVTVLPPVTGLQPTTVKLASAKPGSPVAMASSVPETPASSASATPWLSTASSPVAAPAAAPLLLPPPPAPLRSQAMPAPSMMTPVAPVQQSTVTPIIVPQPESTGLNVPPPPMVASVPGPNVRVEEAKRVPLTQGALPAPTPLQTNPLTSLSPSATIGQKTIWAHMGPFRSEQEALAFWDGYRAAHPDFPSVRVRVTKSLSAINRGNAHESLRVGPFAREGFVTALCRSLLDKEGNPVRAGLKCGRVMDMGVASSGDRTPGYLPGSRYKR